MESFSMKANCTFTVRVGMLALLMLASGCATRDEPSVRADSPYVPAGPRATEPRNDEPIVFDPEPELDPESAFTGTETFLGNGEFINREAANRTEPPVQAEGEITLNFEGQGIQEVIHAILGSLLQESYVIAPGISGEVTFSTARPVSRDQLLPILEMLLRWNGATLVWKEGRFHVLPIADAIRGNLTPRVAGGPMQRGYQVLAVPLKYVSPEQMRTILEPYAREDAIVSADPLRSLLVLAGTRAELRNYLQIIETFDVDWLQGMSIGIFQIQRVEVADLIAELEGVFGADAESSPLAGMFRIMPLERLNSVMVITPQEHYLREIERWIQRLDRSSPEAGARLYVYKVKNLDADVLAGYLSNLFGSGAGGGRATRRSDRGELAPGLEVATASSVSEFQTQTGPQAQARRSGQDGGGTSVTLGQNGDIRVTAVMETNSLLIQASPSEYDAILSAIERLDEEPLQVLIEAQVLVVNLTDELQYGVSWFLANSLPDNPDFPGVPEGFVDSRAASNVAFGANSNFLAAIARSVGRDFVSATINALESVSDVRTISAPSLMVRNNAEARINVGEQIPVQSQTFIGGVNDTGSRLGTTQYLNTGVILEVTPRVNPGGLVYLQVNQEVSSPGQPAPGTFNPPINTRTISTEVAVQSGQTVILGGLISETQTNSKSGVPFLQRIPGLGALFRSTTDNVSRSETLVLITPTVVENTDQLQRASDEFGRKFRGLDPLRIRAGGQLPERETP